MIKITESPPIDKWSEFVHTHPNGNIFQSPEMAQVFRHTKNYEPISLAAIDEDTGLILALMLSVIIKESNRFLGDLSARAIIQGGPLFLNDLSGQNAVLVLIESYNELVNKKGLYSEIRMLSDIPEFNHIISGCGYVYDKHFNALINIKNKTIDDIWQQIKRDKKRGIKKAEEIGMTIEECVDKERIGIVYDLISETYKLAKIPLADISLFESVFDILVPHNRALILLVKYNGEYIATQVAIMDQKTIYGWYTGASRKFISDHPGDLLIWYLLKWGIEKGYSSFDFGGGGTDDKNLNLREYKSRFGTEFPEFGRYKKIHSPLKMKIAEKGFKIYRTLIH